MPKKAFDKIQHPFMTKTLSKITEEGTLPNSFYEATITLITKPDKDDTQKEKRIKSTKLEMKKKRLQKTMQKYKGL